MQSTVEEQEDGDGRAAGTSPSSWTATDAGRRGAACRARPDIAPASRRSGAVVEAAPGSRRRDADAVCLLVRQLAAPRPRGEGPDGAAAALSAGRSARAGRERDAPHRHRPPRPPAGGSEPRRSPGSSRPPRRAGASICGSPSTTPRATPSLRRRRTGSPRRRPRARPSAGCSARRLARPAPVAAARRRSPHPLGRREAAVGLPAVGIRLCRALLRRHAVARFRRRRSARRDGRIPPPRAALRRGLRRRAAYRRRVDQAATRH